MSRDPGFVAKLIRSIRSRGLRSSLRRFRQLYRYYLYRHFPRLARLVDRFPDRFDRRYGVDTRRVTLAENIETASSNLRFSSSYVAVEESELRRLLGQMGIAYQEWTFVDLGSGKGRALMLAAAFPFRRIIGVEFSAELHRVAQRNIETFLKSGDDEVACSDITSVCHDAADYTLPDEKLLIFMFNPFGDAVMARVIENIRRFIEGRSSEVQILYLDPRCKAMFAEVPGLRWIRGDDYYVVFGT